MWQAQYQTTTDVPAEKLFRAISDINSWSRWDAGLELAPAQTAAFIRYASAAPDAGASLSS